MIRTDRRVRGLFIVLASLTLALAMLALAVIPAQATAPLGLTPEASHDSVVLNWWHQFPDNVDSYVILRWDIDSQATGFAVLEENTGTTSTSYTDNSVEPNTRYIYQVKAIYEHGTSQGSRNLRVVRTPADPNAGTEPEQVEEDTAIWMGIDISPAIFEEGDYGRVTLAATGLEAESNYSFQFDVVDEDGSNVDACEDWRGTSGLRTGGSDDNSHVQEETISENCPEGSYTLRLRWFMYKEDFRVKEDSGTVTKDFEVIPDSDPRTDFERVDYITPLYPDPPAAHDPILMGTITSPSPSEADVSFSVGGLVTDSDPTTTDYVVSMRVVDEDNVPVEECNQGPQVGGSYLIKTVPDNGQWSIDLGTLSRTCASGLRIELLNGSYEYLRHLAPRSVWPIPSRPAANTSATGQPTVSGIARVRETLTADTTGISDEDGLDNATYTYQWIRNDGNSETDISEATSTTYLVTAEDVGKTLKVRVSFTDDASNEEVLSSAATAVVAAAVPAAPRSVAVQPLATGQLTVSWQAPESDGGADITGYTVQWKEAADSWDTAEDVSSATTTEASYTIRSLSLDTEYAVRVKATNSVGDGEASEEVTETALALTSEQQEATQNIPATGVLTIRGTAEVGETLTADTSGISDEDGPITPAFVYQWLSDDTAIVGATGASYTLTDSVQGKAIKVRVSFTDDAGNEETLTSEAIVVPVRPYGLTATVSGSAVVLNWNTPVGFQYLYDYRIMRNRPELGEAEPLMYVDTGTAETTYTDADVEPGVLYVYRVKAANYFSRFSKTSEPVEVRIPETVPTANSPATGAPTISGTAQVDETLMADVSDIADADGLDNVSFSYQWVVNDGSTDADIQDATTSTYTLTSDDEGKTLKVRVTFSDDADNEESLTSTATAAVAVAPAPLTASIHDSPERHDGENSLTFELRFSETPVSNFSYETLRDHAFTVTGGSVTNATRQEPPGNVRWEITVEPSSDDDMSIVLPETTDCAGQGAICTEDGRMLSAGVELTVSGPVEEEDQATPENNPASGVPTISGTAQVEETLTADVSAISDADGLGNVAYSYQWVRNDEGADSDIQGATASIYTLDAADESKTIKVRVTFSDDAGNEESLTSQATEEVAPPPLTVSVTTAAPATHDGSAEFTFEIRFSEEPHADFSYRTLRDHAFTITGGAVKKAKRLQKDPLSNIPWRITVRPEGNGDVTVALPVTTDCNNEGAICTGDDRMLSNQLEFTVSGPGQ